MEGLTRHGEARRLDHSRLEPGHLTRGRERALPVEHALQRLGLRDVEVVARDQAHAGAALRRRKHRVLKQLEATVLDECRDDRDVASGREKRSDVGEERVAHPADDQRLGGSSLVVALPRDDVSDAATRIVHVALIARNDMDVEVHHGLAGGEPCVETDVVACGAVLRVELPLHHLDEVEDRELLVTSRLEPVGHDPARDDERVPFGDGVGVTDRERERIRGDPSLARDLGKRRGHRPCYSTPGRRLPSRSASRE
ncbi:hypothetical protein AMOR_18070 [Anaeromyxobacter oryzae]|uniref:Uncharacterized protein n=1 Tax=Anaeromyxobacter oryzae TaxID=2918170 RepID=A0ABM7WTK5_9BACT|nr:hypothetical protein AMOR_18070 [Anaeromyxobacter oryzae]